jgi:CheY-like chemotaxis protein
MIVSEVTMPKTDGLELKRIIEMTPELKTKAIPFFYLTEVTLDAVIKTAYGMGIQGYFRKSHDTEKLMKDLTCIFEFWTHCIHPKDMK